MMDILHKKLLVDGDNCFVLKASIDEPYIYLQFRGKVKHQYTSEDFTMYHVQIQEILEDKETIRSYMNRHRFRIYDTRNGRTYNKPFYTYDILDTVNFVQDFFLRYSNCHFDSNAMFVFQTEDEMVEYRKKAIEHLKEKLTNTISVLNSQLDGNNR